jgi:hypothetical protein
VLEERVRGDGRDVRDLLLHRGLDEEPLVEGKMMPLPAIFAMRTPHLVSRFEPTWLVPSDPIYKRCSVSGTRCSMWALSESIDVSCSISGRHVWSKVGTWNCWRHVR